MSQSGQRTPTGCFRASFLRIVAESIRIARWLSYPYSVITVKLSSKTYQLIQLLGSISSIGMALAAARFLVVDYANWQGFLYAGLFFAFIGILVFMQLARSRLTTLRGKEVVSSADHEYEVFYQRPFKGTPHLQIHSFRANLGVPRAPAGTRLGTHDPTEYSRPAPACVVSEQRSDGFRIEAHNSVGAWCFKWRAEGLRAR